ncbi:phenylacetate-CoA oxygenase subunit PaaJ [Aneurinibacillus thermoaerophilus]|uniref:Phenylacetate-CoA oxygenase subunit PaaJ n=2 Tax=Aneurinibacillus group TaxID=85151 RepID=A0ABX8YFK5_ANETH|nr:MULTISPECIES: 1,2-phenylacetyl-CoA epoxidase subunit PaaD [Aneurinibacillus]MED0675213.1 phenylacetate-CoA oxygenase subunit PaaJ [Aneurinibacillus thermoaerophilus]MED0738151.1 phenylacetate-CoA oxygenase subunit PaaJ [Aneurinibacillus thermoaerophilus]MED0758231.1 phenylacetate-CoA oxygenase subunit PaaJ [Aneurinibacillus thermoaerophilus]MED0761385.1 phenylacetate-CoA oxygenase subunit PaaJ [Aneurinibacillus thermoaerophilus]QYY44567.1 phenylacetate-CoA oxygenase subunit PaaJ [Aneuriniba
METQIESAVWEKLQDVKDPEIPAVSMVEMGMIHAVDEQDGVVTVQVLPTFVGCPALDIMRNEIIRQLQTVEGVQEVRVTFVYDPAWTSERISEAGREKLRQFGIAPPPVNHKPGDPWQVDCPFCGSPYTTLDNLFGPAACRSILYCKQCKNPFEALKPI